MRFLVLMLVLLSFVSHAKDHIVVPAKIDCFKLETLLSNIKDKFGEEPIVIGSSQLESDVETVIYVNQTTGTYTVVLRGKGLGCILDVGNNVRYRMPKMLENNMM